MIRACGLIVPRRLKRPFKPKSQVLVLILATQTIQRRAADAVAASKVVSIDVMPDKLSTKRFQLGVIQFSLHSELHAIRFGARDAFSGTLPYKIALEFTYCRQHMK